MADIQTSYVILTADVASSRVALSEVRAFDPDLWLHKWLAPGIGWVELSSDWNAVAAHFRERPPVFCRHICPVEVRVPLAQNPSDLDALAEICGQFVPRMSASETFSVQTRLLGKGWPYARYDVNVKLSDVFVKHGVPLDVRQPAQILSVVLAPDQGYLGLSWAIDNVSDWAGGIRRFKREVGQISRAEFKLLEAMESFGLSLRSGDKGLDLGAAPGGWTRILRKYGMNVVAVDPAALDPRLASDVAIRHVRDVAQSYLSKTGEQFDVILNDMRMDARDSAQLMVRAVRNLEARGWALLTLKLPKNRMLRVYTVALEILREAYDVTGARQLFHNRSEVTVALKRTRSRG